MKYALSLNLHTKHDFLLCQLIHATINYKQNVQVSVSQYCVRWFVCMAGPRTTGAVIFALALNLHQVGNLRNFIHSYERT